MISSSFIFFTILISSNGCIIESSFELCSRPSTCPIWCRAAVWKSQVSASFPLNDHGWSILKCARPSSLGANAWPSFNIRPSNGLPSPWSRLKNPKRILVDGDLWFSQNVNADTLSHFSNAILISILACSGTFLSKEQLRLVCVHLGRPAKQENKLFVKFIDNKAGGIHCILPIYNIRHAAAWDHHTHLGVCVHIFVAGEVEVFLVYADCQGQNLACASFASQLALA